MNTPTAPRRVNTLLRSLTGPRYLITQWPWRALAYSMNTVFMGIVLVVAAMPVYLPWILLVSFLVQGHENALRLGVMLPLFFGGLVMVGAFSPILALPLAALERRRLLLVSSGPVNSGHRVPPAGLWGWVRTRYTEGATWREVAYMFLLMPLSGLVLMVMVTLGSLALVLGLSPILVNETPDAAVSIGFVTITTVEQALPFVLLSPLALVVMLYASGFLTQSHVVIARALLVGPPKEELRAELGQVTESRVRLVNAFEYERRRIERDLHDGAQQRLVALSMDLGLARLDMEEGSEADRRVVAAQAKANELIDELRELVRGIHPRVLTDRGLPAALAELADRCPVPTRVDAEVPRRLPAHVEGTAYFVVAEALTNVYKHTGANAATVHASTAPASPTPVGAGPGGPTAPDVLLIEITDHGAGGADPAKGTGLTGLKDRVAVMGGTMELSSPEGGPTRIRVELPCGPIPQSPPT